MSDTQNVKLGVCRVKLDGVDLGYTKGGVEVEVTTDTHKVTVDQFGETEINELIMKRSVRVRVPLAETTLENMVRLFPGATLVDNGTKQVSTVTVATAQNATEYKVTIDGVEYTYTSDVDATQGEIALGLVAAINEAGGDMEASTTATASDITSQDVVLTSRISGKSHTVTVSNNLTVAQTTAPVAGAKRVDIRDGVGSNLLSIAKELILHPKDKPWSDKSEDFIVPKAATAGALQFAYKFDEERIFNVEFVGYPDANTGLLFRFGDPAAV